MAEPLGPAQAEVNQIGQMIEREPERIAEMLRAWLERAGRQVGGERVSAEDRLTPPTG